MKSKLILTSLVFLLVTGRSGAGTSGQISKDGITWTFDKPYETGKFANGDWWITGPVTVTGISRPHNTAGRDGSQINPIAGGPHGYDSRIPGYQAAADVSLKIPITLSPGQSLISTISWEPHEEGAPVFIETKQTTRPTVRYAAVLTALSEAPLAGSFRPPYTGTRKTSFNVSQLHRELLPKLTAFSSPPDLTEKADLFSGVWLDHVQGDAGRYVHPWANMPSYYREFITRINVGILSLMIESINREQLLVNVVQLGIDLYEIFDTAPAGYYKLDGHHMGRKWPIMFAGIMLDNAAMKNVGRDNPAGTFAMDCMTFYVTQEDKNRFPSVFPVIGLPEWGVRHCYRPADDNNKRQYETCCISITFAGTALGALIMHDAAGVPARTLWNWNAFFDYTDRFVSYGHANTYNDAFIQIMWMRFRNNLPGPVTVLEDKYQYNAGLPGTGQDNRGVNYLLSGKPITNIPSGFTGIYLVREGDNVKKVMVVK
jgi:hypothetical protein